MSIVFLFLGFAFFLSLARTLYKTQWNKKLKAEVAFEEQVVNEGDQGHIVETVSNDKLLPLPVTTVRFEMDRSIVYENKENVSVSDKVYRNDSMSIRGHQTTRRRFPVRFLRRGIYSVNRVELESLALYANSRFYEIYDQTTEIYVYPSYSHYLDIVAPFSKVMGEAIRKNYLYEDPFEFRGIRDYTGTEPMKKINWSASARSGELKVNQYFDTTSRHVTLLLDIANHQIWKKEEQLEECIRITRNYMEAFIKNHIPVTIITNGRDVLDGQELDIGSGSDSVFVDMALKKLTRIDVSKPSLRMGDYLCDNHAEREDLCVLLSPNVTPELAQSYMSYLGSAEGEWVAPIPHGEAHKQFASHIHMTYVEVGR